jgi:hypothetical protein
MDIVYYIELLVYDLNNEDAEDVGEVFIDQLGIFGLG